jgi:hypothetical protein
MQEHLFLVKVQHIKITNESMDDICQAILRKAYLILDKNKRRLIESWFEVDLVYSRGYVVIFGWSQDVRIAQSFQEGLFNLIFWYSILNL